MENDERRNRFLRDSAKHLEETSWRWKPSDPLAGTIHDRSRDICDCYDHIKDVVPDNVIRSGFRTYDKEPVISDIEDEDMGEAGVRRREILYLKVQPSEPPCEPRSTEPVYAARGKRKGQPIEIKDIPHHQSGWKNKIRSQGGESRTNIGKSDCCQSTGIASDR